MNSENKGYCKLRNHKKIMSNEIFHNKIISNKKGLSPEIEATIFLLKNISSRLDLGTKKVQRKNLIRYKGRKTKKYLA